MTNKIKKTINEIDINKVLEFLFVFGVLVYTFLKVFDYSQIVDFSSKQRSFLRAVTLLCVLPKAVLQKKNKKELIIAISIEGFAIASYIFSSSLRMLILPTMLIGMKDTDIKQLIKYIFYITIAGVVIHIIGFTYVYCLENGTINGMLHLDKHLAKNVVLYTENNFFSERAALAAAEYVYITNRDDNRYIKFFALLIYALFILLISQSWASVAIIVLVALFLLIEKISFIVKNIEVFKYVTFIISFVLSILVLFGGNLIETSSIVFFINKAVSGRIYACSLARNIIGLSLLPQTFEFEKLILTMPVDNALSGIVLRWGIIFTIPYLVFVYYFAVKCKHDSITNYYIVLLALWYITEVYPIELLSMPLLLIMFSNIYRFNNE